MQSEVKLTCGSLKQTKVYCKVGRWLVPPTKPQNPQSIFKDQVAGGTTGSHRVFIAHVQFSD